MAIAGLRRLSLNRNSLIGVKKLFFRNDQEKIDCLIRFIDSFTLSYITLFKVVRFYIEIRLLRLTSGTELLDLGSNNLDHQEAALIKIIKYMRKKREEFLLYNRFHSFKESVAKFNIPFSVVFKEFQDFVDVDLIIGTKNLDRNLMLDMYNCDLSYFTKKIIPSLNNVMYHLKKFGDGYENMDTYLAGVNTMIISDISHKIKKMIDVNQPLIQRLVTNAISLNDFHIQRNEASLQYLEINKDCEGMFCGETFFGNQLITLEMFQKMVAFDSIYILEKLALQITSMLNKAKSSMDFFFKLSDFLETNLTMTYQNAKIIQLNPFEVNEQMLKLCNDLMVIFTSVEELFNESLNFREFQHLCDHSATNQLKIKVIKYSYDHILQLLMETDQIDGDDRTDFFQQRFKIVIDSLSCGLLGLDTSMDTIIQGLDSN